MADASEVGLDAVPEAGMRVFDMPQDERLKEPVASKLLADLCVFRCSGCGLFLVLAREQLQGKPLAHVGCRKGKWRLLDGKLARAVVLHFLSRQMLAGRPRIPPAQN